MRRPILLFLFAQAAVILILHYLNPFGLEILINKESSLTDREGLVTSISGIVTNVQIKEYYTALTVNTGREKVLVRLDTEADEKELYALTGRDITAAGEISLPSKRRNPGCFDYSLYLRSKGIYTIMKVSEYRINAGKIRKPLAHVLSSLKGSFYSEIRPYLDDDAFSVLAGILFGDKSYMDDDIYEQYQSTGTAHILAVSGLHVSLVYSLIEKLTKGIKSKAVSLLTIFLLYCYAVLSGFCVSVLRASLMIVIKIIAFHIKRPYDSLCAASFTASLILLFSPYALFDSGFQLSFTAAFTLSTAVPFIRSKVRLFAKKKKSLTIERIGVPLSESLAVSLGMAPLIAFHFLNYSFISIFLNFIAIGLAGIILPLGLVCFSASFIFSGFPLALAAAPPELFIRLLSIVNSAGQRLHLSGSCAAPPVHVIFLYYVLFFWFFSETRVIMNRKREEKQLLAIASAIIFIGLLMPKSYDTHIVTFVDVGQGDCIHICADGCNILIDGGGSYYRNTGKDTLKPYLLKNGITRIDYAVITHEDMDHSKGIKELSECFDVKNIITAGNDNDDCAITGFKKDGVSFLFTSDAAKAREEKLINLYPGLKADIVKLGHHGSKTSSSSGYLSTVSPSFAVISCGLNNRYGHPYSGLIEELEKTGIIYGRTDYDGAIYVKSISDDEVILENAAKDRTWHIVIQK